MMGEENNVGILEKLCNKIKPWLVRPNQKLRAIECEIERWWKIKGLKGEFHYKTMKRMSVEIYKDIIEELGKRFNLSKNDKDSMLDAVHCEENEEKFESLKFIDGKGHIVFGWYLTEMKNGKIDLAYVIYNADFEMAIKDEWVFRWWFFIPYGWEYNVLSPDEKGKLDRWCELQFCNKFNQRLQLE